MSKLTEYLKNVRSEMSKVSWPTRNEVASATLLVVVLSTLVSLFVFASDKLLNFLLGIVL
ncbi:MAG: preprotein translocase subunit SecE [Chitinivibrionales bacterium]|nr:preprotein translocase subunit SecE [Chitinivibrionales bacterium]